MSPTQEDSLLNKTVKTMMSQVCKFALTYCCEVLIEGTIGVTVDKQKRIIIHFDDKILSANSTEVCNASHGEPPAVSLPNLSTSQDSNLTDSMRQLSSEVPASLNSYLTGSLSSNWSGGAQSGGSGTSSSTGTGLLKASGWETVPSTKMMSCFQVSSASHAALSQTLNETIAIDSDSDSLDGIPLESMSNRTRRCYANAVPRVMTRSSRKAFRQTRDMKEIITIKDKDLFESGADLDEEMPEDLKSPSQLSVTPKRALASVDCESIPDASESRSLFSDISPQGLCSPEDFDVKSGFELTTTTSKPMCVCEICGRRVPTLCQLEAHLVSKHGVVESDQLGKITHFSCPVCSKNYRFQAQLDKHMVRHEVERPYKCRECRNAYRYEESLALHIQVHSNRLHCNLCNKSYTNKVLFQKHIAYMHEKAKDIKNHSSG